MRILRYCHHHHCSAGLATIARTVALTSHGRGPKVGKKGMGTSLERGGKPGC